MPEMSADEWIALAQRVASCSIDVLPPYRPTATARHVFEDGLRGNKEIAALLFRNEHGTCIALHAHREAPQPTFTLTVPQERRGIGTVWECILRQRFPEMHFECIRANHPINLGSILKRTWAQA